MKDKIVAILRAYIWGDLDDLDYIDAKDIDEIAQKIEAAYSDEEDRLRSNLQALIANHHLAVERAVKAEAAAEALAKRTLSSERFRYD